MVNKDGYAYAYYPQRPNHLVETNKTWTQMVAESKQKKQVIRLNEYQFKGLIEEGVKMVLNELRLGKDSYQAKPKNGGRLNDWEIMNILSTLVSSMIADRRISEEDGEMLLYYALYNNDCYTHADS